MTLETAYFLTGAIFAALGLVLASGAKPALDTLRAFPRSTIASVLLFGGAAIWFLRVIAGLGESDLAGFPREWIFGIFALTALLSFKFLSDLLPIRGLAILMLLSARALLDIGYMKTPYSLVLAGTSYALVILGIWWGASPYVFRNWSTWLSEKRARIAIAGACLFLVGLANLIAGFSVPAIAP